MAWVPSPQLRRSATRLLLPEEGGVFQDGGEAEAGRRPGGVTDFLVRALAPPAGRPGSLLAVEEVVGLRTSFGCLKLIVS